MSFFGRQGRQMGGRWIAARGAAAGLLLAGLFAAAPAQAQTSALPEPGTFDITPFIGFGMGFSDGEGLDDAAFLLGGAFAYNWTTNLALEGEIAIVPDIVGETNEVDVSVTTFSANGVYHFDTGTTIVPYATLGLGFGRTSAEFLDDPDISRTEFAVNFGGGVKAPVADRIHVRGDVRYFAVNDENPSFWRVYGGVIFRLGQ